MKILKSFFGVTKDAPESFMKQSIFIAVLVELLKVKVLSIIFQTSMWKGHCGMCAECITTKVKTEPCLPILSSFELWEESRKRNPRPSEGCWKTFPITTGDKSRMSWTRAHANSNGHCATIAG